MSAVFLVLASLPLASQEIPLEPPRVQTAAPVDLRVAPAALARTEDLVPVAVGGPDAAEGPLLSGTRPFPPELLVGAPLAEPAPGWPQRLMRQGVCGERVVPVLYGGPRSRLARAFWLLDRAGCRPRVLDRTLGPVEVGEREPAPSSSTGMSLETSGSAPLPPVEPPVDLDELALRVGLPGTEILDLRGGDGSHHPWPAAFRAGHVPYSLPIDLTAWMPQGGGWPEPSEIRSRLGGLGPRPSDPVDLRATFYLVGRDGDDPRPLLGHLLLEMGGIHSRIVAPGWQGWSTAGLPTVRIVDSRKVAAMRAAEGLEAAEDRPPRGFALLDLREDWDHALRHLPGAISLPAYRFADELEATLEAHWPGFDRRHLPLVLYCYGLECTRSRIAAAEAARRGYRNLLWLRNGIDEWRALGLPTAGEAPPSR